MRLTLMAVGLAAFFALPSAWAEGDSSPLRVCMAENNAPFSSKPWKAPSVSGLDVEIAKAIAAQLQRPLEIVPFESELEDESNLSQEVNAMLSSGVWHIASGFPMLQQDLGPPGREVARTAEYPGAKSYKQRPWIKLGTLIPSAPYHAVGMTLAVKAPAFANITLANLGDARIGALAGTVAGAATVLFNNRMWQARVRQLSRDDNALEMIDNGTVDTMLVSLSKLDLWRIDKPNSMVKSTGYVHPMRMNLGFVGLTTNKSLLRVVSDVISKAILDGSMAKWASDTNVSWLPPVQPHVSQGPTMMQLLRTGS